MNLRHVISAKWAKLSKPKSTSSNKLCRLFLVGLHLVTFTKLKFVKSGEIRKGCSAHKLVAKDFVCLFQTKIKGWQAVSHSNLGKKEIKKKQHNNKNESIYLYTCRPFMNANGEDDHGTTSKLQGEMRRRWFSDAGC